MASPFLDKLAPETRCRIYEYVLASENPLYHATQLRPFVKKLTGAYPNAEHKDSKPSTDRTLTSTTSTISASASSSTSTSIPEESADSPKLADTAILATRKFVYLEAIDVFYKVNTINLKSDLNGLEIASPLATDLSLIQHVIINLPLQVKRDLVEIPFIPSTLPHAKSAEIHVGVDDHRSPGTVLLLMAATFRRSHGCHACHFDGMGSLVARLSANSEIRRKGTLAVPVTVKLQWKEMVEMFRDPAGDDRPHLPNGLVGSRRGYIDFLRWTIKNYGNTTPFYTMAEKMLHDIRHLKPELSSDFDIHSDELWTYLATNLWAFLGL